MADFCLLEVCSLLMQEREEVDQGGEWKFGGDGKSEGRETIAGMYLLYDTRVYFK